MRVGSASYRSLPATDATPAARLELHKSNTRLMFAALCPTSHSAPNENSDQVYRTLVVQEINRNSQEHQSEDA